MHDHPDPDSLTGWIFWALGSFVGLLYHSGMGLVSLSMMCFGGFLQYKTYKLREREYLARQAGRGTGTP